MGTTESLLAAHFSLGFKQNRDLSQDLSGKKKKNVAVLPRKAFASKSSFFCLMFSHLSVGITLWEVNVSSREKRMDSHF